MARNASTMALRRAQNCLIRSGHHDGHFDLSAAVLSGKRHCRFLVKNQARPAASRRARVALTAETCVFIRWKSRQKLQTSPRGPCPSAAPYATTGLSSRPKQEEPRMKTLILSTMIVPCIVRQLCRPRLAQDAARRQEFLQQVPGMSRKSARTPRTRSDRSSTGSTAARQAPRLTTNYSEANKNSGITWNEANFKEYIKDPKAKVPGTKMFLLPASRTRRKSNDIWAYISGFDKDGKTKTQ